MPNDSSVLSEDYATRLRELIEHVERGEEEKASRLLDEITKLRENSLFQELGKLTREFHEALNSFRLDSRIANLAEQDFPDARERLKYVINMTAQAADRSLTAVEEATPICERLQRQAQELGTEWRRFTHREMDANDFRTLSGRLQTFFEQLEDDAGKLKNNLFEVTMAQDFQDLTGQVIKRVIALVDEMEANLVELIRISGQNLMPKTLEKKTETEKEDEHDRIKAVGPVVPGVDDVSETVSGQDEVDDLLSSLGF